MFGPNCNKFDLKNIPIKNTEMCIKRTTQLSSPVTSFEKGKVKVQQKQDLKSTVNGRARDG